MSRDNVGWGAPRIHGELAMLGINVSQATIAKYMIRIRKPPSQTWRTFLDNHVRDLVSDQLSRPIKVGLFRIRTLADCITSIGVLHESGIPQNNYIATATRNVRIEFLVGTPDS